MPPILLISAPHKGVPYVPDLMTLSMPFWLTTGLPRKAQIVIIGGTTAILAAITVLAWLI